MPTSRQPANHQPPAPQHPHPVRRYIFLVSRTLILAYVAVCVFMYFYQYRLIYVPDRVLSWSPDRFGMAADELTLTTTDGVRISAWYCPPDQPRGALVLCHGNAGDMADRLTIARAFYDMGLAVLLFDYRGYGLSEGSPDEQGTYLDAEAAWGYLTETAAWPPDRIVLYGESIGGAVAVELAARHRPAALITESTFTALYDVAAKIYPFLPVKLLCRARYESLDKIGGVSCPKLFIHSPDDELVPYEQGQTLFEAAAPPKRFLPTRGGHNDGGFLSHPDYVEQVRRFIDDALQGKAGTTNARQN